MRISDDDIEEKKYQNYLLNIITIIKKQAEEAKKDAEAPKEGLESYIKGELVVYHRVFSTMKN